MTTMQWDVLALGAVAVDDILYVAQFPQPDAKVRVAQKRREGGGLAGTALVAAARLEARTAYCGVLGDDELSRFTLQQLEAEKVDCSPVLHDAAARPHYSVIVVDQSSGSRCILAMDEGVRPYPLERITAELVSRCRVLFVDHTSRRSGARAALLARELGVPVVADVERRDEAGVDEIIELADHLIINLEFGRALTHEQDAAAVLRALMRTENRKWERQCCVLTDGANGCWYATPESAARHVPACKVAVVDTTGCGDVFHGAYAACLARGEAIERAIGAASAAAALKATQPGGRSGIPHRAALEAFLAAR